MGSTAAQGFGVGFVFALLILIKARNFVLLEVWKERTPHV